MFNMLKLLHVSFDDQQSYEAIFYKTELLSQLCTTQF